MTRVILPPAQRVTRKCPGHFRTTTERLEGQVHFCRCAFSPAEDISIIVDVDRSLKEILEGAADALSYVPEWERV